MPAVYYCVNYENCKGYVDQYGHMCAKCEREAHRLSTRIDTEDKPQYVDKNEGLRRTVRSWWKKG